MFTGKEPMVKRLNVRAEVRRIGKDPLAEFLETGFPAKEVGSLRFKYEEAYRLYALAMERALEQISTTVRYRKGPYYVHKFGGKYGPRQRKIVERHRKLHRFLELDITTCILHARILMDRCIGLSRVFLNGKQLPSFTSFNDHKKFLLKQEDCSSLPEHSEYTRYIREQTDWFDVPVKFVRDKLIVHSGPKHWRVFGIDWEGDDLTLHFVLFDQSGGRELSIDAHHIPVSVWQLSYDIEAFLTWFAGYGIRVLRAKEANKPLNRTPSGAG
jgi:hypothetical protein